MQFNVFYDELARGPALFTALLSGFSPAEARRPPAPEAWPALEVLRHLINEERGDFRRHLSRALQQPVPGYDPATPPLHDDGRDLPALLDEWVRERERSLAWLQALPPADWKVEITLTFGPTESFTLKAGDMLASWAAHDNLHLRQLVELRHARLLALAAPYGVQYAGPW